MLLSEPNTFHSVAFMLHNKARNKMNIPRLVLFNFKQFQFHVLSIEWHRRQHLPLISFSLFEISFLILVAFASDKSETAEN